jgi:hypothetical protein
LTEFDLRALLELLHAKEVRFVVIGAKRGLGRAGVHAAYGQGRRFDPATDAGVIRRGGNVTADTKFGGLDVLQRARGVPSYSRLAEDAVESELLGVPVRVCSLPRLREMKEVQGRAEDRADLENLPEN